MGKYIQKCKALGEIVVMDVRPLTRARTMALAAASGKRRKVATTGGGEFSLPGQSVRLEKPVACRKSTTSVPKLVDRCPSSDRISASRCSSDGSCEQVLGRWRSGDLEGDESLDAAADLGSIESRRDTTASSGFLPASDDLDSSTTPSEVNSRRKRTVEKMPSEAEIEDFFCASEKHEHQRFVEKYNFDVKKDTPLEGRYEWVRL